MGKPRVSQLCLSCPAYQEGSLGFRGPIPFLPAPRFLCKIQDGTPAMVSMVDEKMATFEWDFG